MVTNTTPITVLLAEDNPADIEFTREALVDAKIHIDLRVVRDGVVALQYLRREGEYTDAPVPDLILLDLNMPKKDGRAVLEEVKQDEELKVIPVVVLTTSQAHEDIVKSYKLHANCYITKPLDFEQFFKIVQSIERFWFTIVRLPTDEGG